MDIEWQTTFMFEARVIPVDSGSSNLTSVVLEETGGLGVDIIIDSGGKDVFLVFTDISVCDYKCGAAFRLWFHFPYG